MRVPARPAGTANVARCPIRTPLARPWKARSPECLPRPVQAARGRGIFAQVITPGFKLVMDSDGALHTYHTSLDSVVFVESN
ncbi:MAG: hypothetical protein IIB16_09365 [Chloroflexi bacterium]|nr:hypothetical protein [Chloroflexota bacterium]